MSFTQVPETFLDTRDGQSYKTVTIGTQTWMAENLNYNAPDSWCYAESIPNCNIFGRLYTWKAAKDACPENWHLPSDEEWKILERYIGMTNEETDMFLYRGEGKGTKLKIMTAWGSNPDPGLEFNTTGFNALPAGFRMYGDGSFIDKGKSTRWWTSTVDVWRGVTFAYRRCLYLDKTGIDRDAATIYLGFSVRCIRNL